MIGKASVAIIAGLMLCMPAFAEDASPDNGQGRYTFNKVPDGFLRLDTQTGEVSLCSQRSVGWACTALPEDRAVLEDEIGRLRSENGALKKELLSRGLPLPSKAAPSPPVVQNGPPALRSPGNADIDRMMAFVGQVWRRLVGAIANAQRQVLHSS
jgi:hypothetical protein